MLQDKKKGVFLGLAYGDILGCPVETWRDYEIKKIYGEYNDLPKEYPFTQIKEINKLKKLRPLGLHSDDTQQAMALLTIILSGEWNIPAWQNLLIQGFDKRAWRGYGRNFKEAVDRMKRGTAPQLAGTSTAGIGAAMRVAPIGAVYYDNNDELEKCIAESTLMTHGDIRAASFSYAVAFVVQYLLSQEHADWITVEWIADNVAEYTNNFEDKLRKEYKHWSMDSLEPYVVSNTLQSFFSVDHGNPKEMREAISKLAKPLLQDGHTKAHPNQGFVMLGGLHAMAMALKDNRPPKEVLLDIIRQGYDSDTVAAIAGGMLGARYGSEWIPVEQFYDKERILNYASALAGEGKVETVAEFLKNEARLTKEEREWSQNYR